MKKALRAALLLSLVAMAPMAQADSGLAQAAESRECSTVGQVFLRLAEQRNAGVGAGEAARRVLEWLAGVNHTGTHLRQGPKAVVEEAAHLVYKVGDLNAIAMGAFGKGFCHLQFAFDGDKDRQTAALVKLVQGSRVCQKDNPGDQHNSGLSECIATQARGLEGQLRNARIEIR